MLDAKFKNGYDAKVFERLLHVIITLPMPLMTLMLTKNERHFE